MSNLILLVATLQGLASGMPDNAPGQPSIAQTPATELTPAQLRVAVSTALRQEAAAQGPDHAAAVRRLVELHEALVHDTQMGRESRLQLRAKVRSRLVRVSEKLTRRNQLAEAKEAQAANQAPLRPPALIARPDEAILAQQLGPGAGPVPGVRPPANDDDGPALVELIERTIAPHTWEANGGLGTIMYYRPLRVLVVRQTAEVHDNLGDVLKGLRQ